MTTMSPDQTEIVRLLVAFAGDPLIVQDAMRDVTAGPITDATMEQLVRRIAELKAQRAAAQTAPTAAPVG